MLARGVEAVYRLVTAQQSRQLEHAAVEHGAVDLAELMRRAGEALAQAAEAALDPAGAVVVMSGGGNNGGDGWVAARYLHAAGIPVRVMCTHAIDQLEGIARDAAEQAVTAGVRADAPASVGALEAALAECEVVIDALLGTGARLPLDESLAAWCRLGRAHGAVRISADIPTGVDADTGACDVDAFEADITVTFGAPKLGLVMHPGASRSGEIVVADIGIDDELIDLAGAPRLHTEAEYVARLPKHRPDIHKNERGRVLVVAGSGSFPGAAVLAARGAMRAGAGYVTLAVPAPVVHIAQSHLLAAPVVGLPSSGGALSSTAAALVIDMAADYDAVVVGPGLTLAHGAVAAVRAMVAGIDVPLVLDADGLNAFTDHLDLLDMRVATTILTPHPGELGRLLGTDAAAVQADRLSAVQRLARPRRTVVLKGASTLIADEAGLVVNTSGTPALAAAGTGDVLAGMIGSLVAQGLVPFDAACVGVYVHGRAGEAAARTHTHLCVTAEDIPDAIPSAVASMLHTW